MINDATKIQHSLVIYKKLLRATKTYLGLLMLGLIGTVFAAGTDGLLSWLIKPLIDHGLVQHNKTYIIWMPIFLVLGFMLRGGTYFMSNYFIARVGRSVVTDFRQKVFAHFLNLPATFYDSESSGQLLSLVIYNTDQLAFATTDSILTILQEGLQALAFIVVMFVLSWKLTLLFMIIAPPIMYIVRYTNRRLRKLNNNVQRTVGDIAHIVEESINAYRVIRIFGGENYEREKFNKTSNFNRQCELKVVVTNSIGTSIVQILASIPIAFILYIINVPFFALSVGSFGAIIVAMVRLLTPIRRLTKVNSDIQKGIAAANGIFNLLETPPEKDLGEKTIARATGHIEYRDVHFKYPKAHKNVLRGISFTIEPGQTIALVGRSGSGKSTTVSLLPRFYDVINGGIFIDGININEYKLKDLRHQLSYVSQNVVLFNDTIARNIAYARFHEAKKSEIMAALDAAYLTEYVNQLPEGIDTMIGENGLLLSGGQRQRIAIARAILKDAPILILDEATSSLDTESEHYIQAALDNLMKKCTTLVIAHRLSTVEKADKIMVMEQGHIVESGSHQELIAQNGQYAKLYKMQFKNKKDK